MKTARYSDAQIMGILKQAEGGVPISELCREHGMSSASFYKWRAKFGGMDASLIVTQPRLPSLQSLPFSGLPHVMRPQQ
jgi:transposase-like protein